ncbi:Protein of unknown function [Nonlabens sp. Hel1_33_55]|nr:Protein of unknown function [Nonlabens sp. Hel1_33_55]
MIVAGCQQNQKNITTENPEVEVAVDSIATPQLTLEQANNLALLPLHCVDQEYPNKMGHVTATPEDQKRPTVQHPAFYGCFDWHSAVHGHWSAVALFKKFPDLDNASKLLDKLTSNITSENIAVEIAYLNTDNNASFERTYGWAWLLKLQQELDTWDSDEARQMAQALQPLSTLISERYIDYLPKLNYAIRVGEHSNTAFGMAFAWDYAVHANDGALKKAIESKAIEFYKNDKDCPLGWEPSGYDFLSPCLEEVDIMRRVLPADEFHSWLTNFLPGIENGKLDLELGEVSDRTDGKLVHIDGLNLSRAWVLYGLANQYERYGNLIETADEHITYTLPNLVADDYEGGHWLGSFAIYALQQADVN